MTILLAEKSQDDLQAEMKVLWSELQQEIARRQKLETALCEMQDCEHRLRCNPASWGGLPDEIDRARLLAVTAYIEDLQSH